MMTHTDVLATYRRLRQAGLRLNHKLVKTLSRAAFDEGGRRLGILQNGTFVFDSEDQTSILMDYCIHNVRIGGRNAVQRFMEESPPPADSEEMAVLRSMLKGYYAIMEVTDVEPGVGVTVRDILRGDTHFMADIGFGTTAEKGFVVATRVFPLDEGFLMSGGAGLPLTPPALARFTNELKRMFGPATDFAQLTPDQEADLAALTIRTCLTLGMGSRIMYGTSAETSSGNGSPIDTREVRRANRNDPCPCGSGRKFKSCCGRRPQR